MGSIKLLTDQALFEGEGRTVDGLGFDNYARILAKAAKDTTGPFTIGIYGEWGTGKTSLLRLIQKGLKDDNSIVTVGLHP
jgi:pantothenate kinase-related protein Tda10